MYISDQNPGLVSSSINIRQILNYTLAEQKLHEPKLPITRNLCFAGHSPQQYRSHKVPVISITTPRNNMCSVQYWRSPNCSHRWMTIKKPCAEGRNFSNCPSFEDRKARLASTRGRWAPRGSCPKHDKKGDYDTDTMRVISKVTYGVRLGDGPSRAGNGVDVVCCSVM